MFTGLGPSQDDPQNVDEYYHAFTVKRDILGLDPVEVTLAQHLFKPFLRQNMTVRLFASYWKSCFITFVASREVRVAVFDREHSRPRDGGMSWVDYYRRPVAFCQGKTNWQKHAIGDLYRRENSDFEGRFPWEELFFEDEALAEYGYSLTMAVSLHHDSLKTTSANL